MRVQNQHNKENRHDWAKMLVPDYEIEEGKTLVQLVGENVTVSVFNELHKHIGYPKQTRRATWVLKGIAYKKDILNLASLINVNPIVLVLVYEMGNGERYLTINEFFELINEYKNLPFRYKS